MERNKLYLLCTSRESKSVYCFHAVFIITKNSSLVVVVDILFSTLTTVSVVSREFILLFYGELLGSADYVSAL